MTAALSPDRDDLPSAERVVAADVADVYAAIERVDAWSSWVDELAAPVRTLGDDSYELMQMRDGNTTTHRLVITSRGPVHTLFVQVDDTYRIYFRTRPHQPGTHVQVIAEPISKPSWWQRLRHRQTTERRTARLDRFLEALAAHVEK